jgi:hypothetical protein
VISLPMKDPKNVSLLICSLSLALWSLTL